MKRSKILVTEYRDLPLGITKKAKNYIKSRNYTDKVPKDSDKVISQESYDEKLDTVIQKTKSTIVIRGTKHDVFNTVKQNLINNNKISKVESLKIQDEKTIKSILCHTFIQKLKMDPLSYNSLEMIKVYKTDTIDNNLDIVVEFKNPSNVGFIYSLTKNIDKNDPISIAEYVPAELFKRHRELNSISKILRDEGNVTHIRLGQKDYNLYAKPKNDITKWTDIIPYKLSDDIHKFEIGILPYYSTNKRIRIEETEKTDNENINHNQIVEDVIGEMVETAGQNIANLVNMEYDDEK